MSPVKINILPPEMQRRALICSRLTPSEVKRHSLQISLAAKRGFVPRDQIKPLGSPLLEAMVDRFYTPPIGSRRFSLKSAGRWVLDHKDRVHQFTAQSGLLEKFSSVLFTLDTERQAAFYHALYILSKFPLPASRDKGFSGVVNYLFEASVADRKKDILEIDHGLSEALFRTSEGRVSISEPSLSFLLRNIGVEMSQAPSALQARIKIPVSQTGVKEEPVRPLESFMPRPYQPALPGKVMRFQLALPTCRDMVTTIDREYEWSLAFLIIGVVYGNCERAIAAQNKINHRSKTVGALKAFLERLDRFADIIDLYAKVRREDASYSDRVEIPEFMVPEAERIIARSKYLGVYNPRVRKTAGKKKAAAKAKDGVA